MMSSASLSSGVALRGLLVAFLLFLLTTIAVYAQEITGVPGSPSATITIDGEQLPPPPPKFGGVIKQSVKDSTPWWPPRVVPSKGAPNVERVTRNG